MISRQEARSRFTEDAWASYLNVRKHKRGEPVIVFVVEKHALANDPILVTLTTQDLLGRIAALQRRNPNELVVLQVVCGDRDLRDSLWDMWADSCVRGGWFAGIRDEVLAVANHIANLQFEGRWLESRFTSALTP